MLLSQLILRMMQVASRITWAMDDEGPAGGQLGMSSSYVTRWSVLRRNFNQSPSFKVTRNVTTLIGFNHPSSNPLTIEGLLDDLVEPPFTPVSLTGTPQLTWLVEVVRYKSEMSSNIWVSGPGDGGVFAALPAILVNCSSVCTSADMTLAQSDEMRNGVVEFRITLNPAAQFQGVPLHATQSLLVETILVIDVPRNVNMTEDHSRDPYLFYSPRVLKTQTIPCMTRLKFAGDLAAPYTLSSLQFMFDLDTSYTGSTTILSLVSFPLVSFA
jgi:hypothetical protein